MISLCSIDAAHSGLGTEVVVLWGDPGARQKEIRATVSRFPYLNENRNENVYVSKIPRIAGKEWRALPATHPRRVPQIAEVKVIDSLIWAFTSLAERGGLPYRIIVYC